MRARVLGSDTEVECADGVRRRYVNLDNAASTPVLAEVWEAVAEFMPLSSSVHRGSGQKSQLSTAAYESARGSVARLAGARRSDEVVFVRNTTEAINVLAAALPAGTRVLCSPAEHHSNLLPWRRHDVELLPFTRTPGEIVARCEAALERAPIGLVAVTGASNVTGEVWPIAEIAEVAHFHGAKLLVDAAQLAPHRPIDMAAAGIDYVALSGHKLYAPFGAGALVGDMRILRHAPPLLQGGGAVELVTLDDVVWADAPERFEAGSPNVVGAIALGAACDWLMATGMDAVARHEQALAERLWRRLADVPGLDMLTLWPEGAADRVGVATFVLDGHRHPLVAAALAAEHAIGVRHGCFCAHPLIARLLDLPPRDVARLERRLRAGIRGLLPGAVRASIGLATTAEDIDLLAAGLTELAVAGPRLDYEHDVERDEYTPRADLAAAA
jgi:selenocysteine lyase/cysteine desulfurase